MEISLRYIPTDHIVVDGKMKAAGNKPALCFLDSENAQCIVNNEEMVEVVTLPLEEVQNSPLVKLNGAEQYPVSTYLLHVEGWDKPISLEAQDLLTLIQDPPKKLPKRRSTGAQTPGSRKRRTNPGSIINVLAEEHKLPPTKIRKFLRSQGMHAPYDDEKKVRAAMKSFGKPKAKEGSKSHGKAKAKAKGK